MSKLLKDATTKAMHQFTRVNSNFDSVTVLDREAIDIYINNAEKVINHIYLGNIK
jgi:ADP-dependent phosphofructokinase/glucokinase